MSDSARRSRRRSAFWLGAGSSGVATEVGHAEVDGERLGRTVAHGLQLQGGGQGGLDGGDFAEPALVPGLLEAVDEVGVDLLEAWHLGGVHKQ